MRLCCIIGVFHFPERCIVLSEDIDSAGVRRDADKVMSLNTIFPILVSASGLIRCVHYCRVDTLCRTLLIPYTMAVIGLQLQWPTLMRRIVACRTARLSLPFVIQHVFNWMCSVSPTDVSMPKSRLRPILTRPSTSHMVFRLSSRTCTNRRSATLPFPVAATISLNSAAH